MRTRISIVGVGGIGSNLVCGLAPAIACEVLLESLGGVELALIDSDTVEARNVMMGQRFGHDDVGESKVCSVSRSISGFAGPMLRVESLERDVRSEGDIPGSDIVVVCVDNMAARSVVHNSGSHWLDLRCSGDAYIALDHRVEPSEVTSLTGGSGARASCQLEGWESGFLQSGYLAAAAHGCQWVVSELRMRAGMPSTLPMPRSSSITFGMLGQLPVMGAVN